MDTATRNKHPAFGLRELPYGTHKKISEWNKNDWTPPDRMRYSTCDTMAKLDMVTTDIPESELTDWLKEAGAAFARACARNTVEYNEIWNYVSRMIALRPDQYKTFVHGAIATAETAAVELTKTLHREMRASGQSEYKAFAELIRSIARTPEGEEYNKFVPRPKLVDAALSIIWLLGYWTDELAFTMKQEKCTSNKCCIKMVVDSTDLVSALEESGQMYNPPEVLIFTYNAITVRRLYAATHTQEDTEALRKQYKTEHTVHIAWERIDDDIRNIQDYDGLYAIKDLLKQIVVEELGYVGRYTTDVGDRLDVGSEIDEDDALGWQPIDPEDPPPTFTHLTIVPDSHLDTSGDSVMQQSLMACVTSDDIVRALQLLATEEFRAAAQKSLKPAQFRTALVFLCMLTFNYTKKNKELMNPIKSIYTLKKFAINVGCAMFHHNTKRQFDANLALYAQPENGQFSSISNLMISVIGEPSHALSINFGLLAEGWKSTLDFLAAKDSSPSNVSTVLACHATRLSFTLKMLIALSTNQSLMNTLNAEYERVANMFSARRVYEERQTAFTVPFEPVVFMLRSVWEGVRTTLAGRKDLVPDKTQKNANTIIYTFNETQRIAVHDAIYPVEVSAAREFVRMISMPVRPDTEIGMLEAVGTICAQITTHN